MSKFPARAAAFALSFLLSGGVALGGLPTRANAAMAVLPAADTALLYGRSLLTASQKQAYDLLTAAIYSGQSDIWLPYLSNDALFQMLNYFRRDNPAVSWVEDSYSFEQPLFNQNYTKLKLSYRKTPQAISAEMAALNAAADLLLANIDPALSDFDKALIVHDRLVDQTRYDLSAPRPSELAGVLLDKRATCDGYSKSYQFLLSRLGIETLIVYGMANESHAWNIVKLNDSYFLVDLTWNDSPLSDGREVISHEYLFCDDLFFSRNHTPLPSGDINYPLPACVSTDQNYFLKNRILLDTDSPASVQDAFSRAFDLTAANRYGSVEICFSSPALAARALDSMGAGGLDVFVSELADRRDMKIVGRIVADNSPVISFIVEY